MDTQVLVVRSVEQVRDGDYYKGSIKIAEKTFKYELKFAIPIGKLDDAPPLEGIEEIRRVFQITVTKDGATLELSELEYGFFFQMLAEFAVDFYNEPQTRKSNLGDMGRLLRAEHPLVDMGKTSIGMTTTGPYNFPSPVCEMLNGPKFGCNLELCDPEDVECVE
ncbi:MAG: hypothetical protein PHS79_01985 [Patescibacteria group bacterium]|nr:hypothetical protein [Patescibacteria group bacterium]